MQNYTFRVRKFSKDDSDLKFKRLKAKLYLKVDEHIASVNTYQTAIDKLDILFITTRYLKSTRNKLITMIGILITYIINTAWIWWTNKII